MVSAPRLARLKTVKPLGELVSLYSFYGWHFAMLGSVLCRVVVRPRQQSLVVRDVRILNFMYAPFVSSPGGEAVPYFPTAYVEELTVDL